VFPVGYPPDFTAGHWLHEETSRVYRRANARLLRNRSPAEISFCNMFGGARGNQGHRAIDILGARGLPIFATCGGQVVETWRASGQRRPGVGSTEHSGNFVMIKDAENRYHYYTHMIDIPALSVGDTVRAGQLLGLLGQTGDGGLGKHPHHTGAVRESLNPYGELVRLAQSCGGAFEEPVYILGYHTRRWMVIRSANFRAGGAGRRQ